MKIAKSIFLGLFLITGIAKASNVEPNLNDTHWQYLKTTGGSPSFPAIQYLGVVSAPYDGGLRAVFFIMRDLTGKPGLGIHIEDGAFNCDMCDLRIRIDNKKIQIVTASVVPNEAEELAILDDKLLHQIRHAHKLAIDLPLLDRYQEVNFDVSGLPKKLP